MFQKVIRTVLSYVQKMRAQPTLHPVIVSRPTNNFVSAAHHTLTISGIVAIVLLGIILAKPGLADQLRMKLPFVPTTVAESNDSSPEIPNSAELQAQTPFNNVDAASSDIDKLKVTSTDAQEKILSESHKQQQLVTFWIAKRYHVAGEAADMFVKTSFTTAKELKLDPLLILAVMAIESRFNPFSESAMGAQGLMQVMPKMHQAKFEALGGIKAALNPAANIRVGAMILKEYVSRGGSVEAGLKSYVGAAEDETDSGYGEKVLEEYRRLKEVATGKRVPLFTTTASSGAPKLPAMIERKLLDTPKETAPNTNSQPSEPPVLKSDQVAML